jgi:hypothetical protein
MMLRGQGGGRFELPVDLRVDPQGGSPMITRMIPPIAL